MHGALRALLSSRSNICLPLWVPKADAARSVVSGYRRRVAIASPVALFGASAFVTRKSSTQGGVTMATTTELRAKGTAAGSDGRSPPVLVVNGQASSAWLSKDELLKKHAGAYTTARTVDQRSIFEFSMHCHRLCQTELAVLQKNDVADNAKSQAIHFLQDDVVGTQKLKPLIAQEIKTALDWLGGDDRSSEYQVTLLLTCESVGPHTPAGRGLDIFTFVQLMPGISPMVDAEAHDAKRNNPTIKDVQWVLDRQQLEAKQREAGVNEIIMFDHDGAVTEGLSSNFFAVAADGTVLTAPTERVLAGTVRKVVVEVCEKHGIPLRFDCPNIKDFSTWDSCFVCSTSRLAKPIRMLKVPGLDGHNSFPDAGSVAHRVESLVLAAVRAHSEPLSAIAKL